MFDQKKIQFQKEEIDCSHSSFVKQDTLGGSRDGKKKYKIGVIKYSKSRDMVC